MIILQILGILVGFGFLIFIHELGHFIAAKVCKVGVLAFALGFGPDIIKFNHLGTKYAIKAFPLGGFVSMAGENPKEAKGEAGEYLSLKWYKKIFIAFMGPFFNYLFAIFLFTFIFNIWGISTVSDSSKIGDVLKDRPATQAGIISGDKIISVDGENVSSWNDLSENLKNKADKKTLFVVERGSYSFDVNILVSKNPITRTGMIGITPYIVHSDVNFLKSVYLGPKAAVDQSVKTVKYLFNKITALEKPELSGPIGIMNVMADATKSGIDKYLKLLAVISVALGLFNLFPIPMVDGGMIILFFVEGIIKKQISTKVVQIYNTIGLFFILAIFIFATYSDLLRLGIDKLFGK
ncbi:MAG: site-2 protease family protein [Endomicrobium sp.]|jgi:regulator of sigma E protease|nr:site-2 protease family protein [Endomicrobium sp.]